MEIIWTRTKTIVTVSVLLVVVLVFVVKKIYFPTVDEACFRLDGDRLQTAPANVLILRPTEFAESRRTGAFTMPVRLKNGQYDPQHMRMVGRNVPLTQVIAQAYQCQESRIIPPTGGDPATHYDFLVTVRQQPAEHLQKAITKKLGYTARWEEREIDVLQLKVQNPGAAGLKPGTSDANRSSDFKNGRLFFYNTPVQNITGMLEYALKKPVQDKTGLTGGYDYSLAWRWQRGGSGPDEAELKKSLAELGLALVTRSDTMRVLVVKSSK